MVMGSSGYSTFVDQVGDLSSVLDKCLGAKILLVNPYSEEVSQRIQAVDHPTYTLTPSGKKSGKASRCSSGSKPWERPSS